MYIKIVIVYKGDNMNREILDNLPFLDEESKGSLLAILESGENVEESFYSALNMLFQKWHEKYPMFKIPSGVISVEVDGERSYYPFGETVYSKDTVFDIASMSKCYTEILFFRVLDDYGLNLDMKIGDLVDFYPGVKDLTLRDLISFNNEYVTTIDIRNCTNKEDAIKALRTSTTKPDKKGYYKYTDLPIMILTDIIETITKKSYKELFEQYIIREYGLEHTYLDIDSDKLALEGMQYVTINHNMTNDPKANIMGGYYGHCGVKTTSEDFLKFFSKVLDCRYKRLFVEKSRTLTDKGTIREDKALVGNMSLPIPTGGGLASSYVTGDGFAIQGSVRSHGETNNFVVNGETHRVSSSIFMDLYTQWDAMKEFERTTGKVYTREYEVDGHGTLVMSDVRDVMTYTADYKLLTNLVGFLRTYMLSKKLQMNAELH